VCPDVHDSELAALRREVARLKSLVAGRPPPLIGRDAELEEVEAKLRSPRGLVTLVGPPGVGKTALARAVVRAAPQRSCFCALGDATDQGRVSALVADALALAEGEGPIDERIGRALRARGRFVLVLDNLEQVQGALDGIEQWRTAAPRLRLVATSRRALGLSLEQVIEIPPLALPASDDDVACHAGQLFLERAKALVPELELTPAAAGAVVRIVRKLDGIPLALELAASRLTRQTLERIAETPEHRRASSIDRAIEASWQLLALSEQRALVICSLFRGAFDLEAAAYVLGVEEGEALLTLQRLVEHSLLVIARRPQGGSRHHMLESIRQFAEARLGEIDGDGAAARRHAEYYLERLHQKRRRHESKNLAAILSRCLADATQVDRAARAAIELAGAGDASALLNAAPELLRSCTPAMRFMVATAAAKSADLLQQPAAAEGFLMNAREATSLLDPEAAARCDLLEARLCLHHGDVDEVRRALARLGGRGVIASDIALEAELLAANADLFEGRLGEAERGFESALERAREHENRAAEARSLNGLSATRHLQGAFTESLEDARAAAALAQQSGDPVAEGRARSNAGLLATEYGDLQAAREELERAHRQLAQHGDLRYAANAAQNLATVYRELGELERATRAALASQRSSGKRLVGFALAELGYIAHDRGDVARARSYYDRALEAHRSAGNRYFAARMLPFRAAALATLGRDGEAEEAFAEAERYFEEVGDRMGAAISHLLRGQSDLAQARSAGDASEPHLVAARARLDREVSGTSPELRFARALLVRDLERASSADAQRLQIASDGSWFELGSVRQELRTRGPLKRILASLAHTAGRTLSVRELFQAGWPGESVQEHSAARRVYVALATLRKLGLRHHIERHSEGYRLSSGWDECATQVNER